MTSCIIATLLSMHSLFSLSVERHVQVLEVDAKATIEKKHYHPLEPIWVKLDLKNDTESTVFQLWTEDPLRAVLIEVEKDGEKVDSTVYGKRFQEPRRYSLDKTELVSPGHSFSFSGCWIPVNWVQDMTEPGEYTIKLSVPFDVEQFEDGKFVTSRGVARANPVTVRVSGSPLRQDEG